MRRLALVAAVLAATACNGGGGEGGGDTTPPAPPVVVIPEDGTTLVYMAFPSSRQVAVHGTAEAGATVAVQIDGAPGGTAVAAADGAWSVTTGPVTYGAHAILARATDAAGNTSAPSVPVSFTLSPRQASETLPGHSPWLTSFAQSGPDTAGLGEVFPGQANTWVIDRDFSLATGFGRQYASALVLYTGTPTAPLSHANLVADVDANALTWYPYDQAASEVLFLTPGFGVLDGVVFAASSDGVAMGLPAISGARSAYLNGTSYSDLWRFISLTPGGIYTFTWTHRAALRADALVGANAAPYGPVYEVTLGDRTTGALIGDPLFSSTDPTISGTVSVTRSGLPAEVMLRFHLRSAAEGYAEIDDVTLADGSGPVALPNGDFEADGLSPWISPTGQELQNVRSGPRDLGTPRLRVTRTFYAPPAATWGRLVDVFENTGTTTVTTKAVYLTVLNGGAALAAATQGGAAVVGWDANAGVRDVGLVSGAGTAFLAEGDPRVFVVHDVSVPPGGKVALVHFVVQLGGADGGTTAADVPAATNDACAAILAGFRTDGAYAIDLEPGVLELVQNL